MGSKRIKSAISRASYYIPRTTHTGHPNLRGIFPVKRSVCRVDAAVYPPSLRTIDILAFARVVIGISIRPLTVKPATRRCTSSTKFRQVLPARLPNCVTAKNGLIWLTSWQFEFPRAPFTLKGNFKHTVPSLPHEFVPCQWKRIRV